MPTHDPRLCLVQMHEHAAEAVALIQGKTRESLDKERVLSLALVRLLEVAGEAANRVGRETQTKYSEIPWQSLISMRNRLIHGYDSVDHDILWQVLSGDLPPMVAALEKILAT